MIGKFFKHYGINKIKDGVQGLQDAIVEFDPEGASDAAIAEMEENFDSINKEFSKAQQDFRKEKAEAIAIVDTYNQRLAAAEHITAQLTDDPDNAQLNEALNQLVSALEDMAEDVESEKEEADFAEEIMNDLQLTVTMYADKLKSARKDMSRAQKDLERAKRQEQRADEQADRAAVAAGIKDRAGGLSSALESMQRQANDSKANADAATRKAQLLSPTLVDENDAVKAAMDAVNGVEKPTSAADRLAALRK